MRTLLLFFVGSALLTGCMSRRTVVYDEPRRTIIAEPAGTTVVYPTRPVYRSYYYDSYGPHKLGEYHMR